MSLQMSVTSKSLEALQQEINNAKRVPYQVVIKGSTIRTPRTKLPLSLENMKFCSQSEYSSACYFIRAHHCVQLLGKERC